MKTLLFTILISLMLAQKKSSNYYFHENQGNTLINTDNTKIDEQALVLSINRLHH